MSLNRYIQFWLLLLVMASSCNAAAAANFREDREEEEEHAWEFNPRFFQSHRSNPLIGRPGPDNQPDYSIHISYYGERFFIDDAIGYTWFENDNFMFNAIATPTEDYVLFSRKYFDTDDVPELNGLERRELSINGGVELLFNGRWGEAALQIQTDLLSKHTGHIVDLAYAYTYGNNNWEIRPKIGLLWKSDNYVNYFYGVSPQDSAATSLPEYRAGAALNWYFSLEAKYEVYPRWNLIAGYYVQQGDDSISDSPLLASDSFKETYVGFEWVKPFSFNF